MPPAAGSMLLQELTCCTCAIQGTPGEGPAACRSPTEHRSIAQQAYPCSMIIPMWKGERQLGMAVEHVVARP